MAPRETIYAAFFALLAGLTGGGNPLFKTASRTLIPPDQVPVEEMPAIYVLQRDEESSTIRGIPDKNVFRLQVYVYATTYGVAQAGTGAPPVSSVLNPLVDAVIAAFGGPGQSAAPSGPNAGGGIAEQTLGGLVSKCRQNGRIEYGEGLEGNYAVALIPVEITVPS